VQVVNAQTLARKLRRALVNGHGTHFSADELRALADFGLLETLNEAEAEEIRAKWQDTRSGTTGSTSAPMAAPHIGKSAGMTRAQRQRAALALVSNG